MPATVAATLAYAEQHIADTIEALKEGEVKHRLTLIRDGLEALEFLSRQGKFAKAPRPDLVLLDLMLPKMSGLDVLSRIRSDFDLRELLQDLLSVLGVAATGKGLEITKHIPSDLPAMLTGDPVRTRQILYNLLGNAIKYSGRSNSKS